VIIYRPREELKGKRLSAHTIASFMVAQNTDSTASIAEGRPMRGDLLRFLLRDRTISYWTKPSNQWLARGPLQAELHLTPEGLRKVQDRLEGRARGQSVAATQVREALLVIRGSLKSEAVDSFSFEGQSQPEATPTEAMEAFLHEATILLRGRNAALRKAALERANGTCEACSVIFSKVLGGTGVRALHVYHRQQLAQREVPSVTKVEDLAVVCANCHALIHADPQCALPVEELRMRLEAERRDA
jgi:predicted HNH restriction endonuclease